MNDEKSKIVSGAWPISMETKQTVDRAHLKNSLEINKCDRNDMAQKYFLIVINQIYSRKLKNFRKNLAWSFNNGNRNIFHYKIAANSKWLSNHLKIYDLMFLSSTRDSMINQMAPKCVTNGSIKRQYFQTRC